MKFRRTGSPFPLDFGSNGESWPHRNQTPTDNRPNTNLPLWIIHHLIIMLAEADTGKQFLFLIRHGDRYDYAHPKVKIISLHRID